MFRGSGAVVAQLLPKQWVAGSNPVSRSNPNFSGFRASLAREVPIPLSLRCWGLRFPLIVAFPPPGDAPCYSFMVTVTVFGVPFPAFGASSVSTPWV